MTKPEMSVHVLSKPCVQLVRRVAQLVGHEHWPQIEKGSLDILEDYTDMVGSDFHFGERLSLVLSKRYPLEAKPCSA